ncbi:flavodoxin family protein [Clostridium felsineum]|uniref:flavodoxin family protein n=1 Tax=Clostridium felsineum TaxID=36839 RepID=UPI00098C745B|nr:flavodoxin family protein [Clostridium felsineum]URZ17591.1 Iron-sulfur flavoprotein [Clostridium felsineum DSM 794]
MKIVAVYGSARKNGNGEVLVERAINNFADKNPEVKRYYLTDMDIKSCMGCFACRKKEMCVRKDDMNDLLNDIIESDFVIFSSPVYMYDASGSFRLMLNRMYPMLGGEPGRYTKRYTDKKCMLIMTQGAPLLMFSGASRTIKRIIKSFGFDVCGLVRMGFANERGAAAKNEKVLRKIDAVCSKAIKL